MNLQPRLDVYMSILGLLILIINYTTMMITFQRKHRMIYGIFAMMLLTVATTFYRRLTVDLIQWNGLSTLFYLVLMIWLLKGPSFQITFAYYFQYIFAIVQLYLAEAVIGIFISKGSENFSLILFISMIIMYTAYVFLMYKYGRRIFRKLLECNRTSEWGLYAFGAIFSFVLLTLSRDYPNTVLLNIVLLLFIVWSFAVFCFAIINAHEKSKQKYEAEFAREVISSGHDHYQKMDELYEKLRVLQHDYKYHLSAVRKMLDSNDTVGVDKYLTDAEKQLAEYELPSYCPNSVINALVASYGERCKKLNITFTVDIAILKTLRIPNYELCIIVGNLLENAVEACERLDSNRKIKLAAQETTAQFMLMAENNFNGVIYCEEDKPISTKTNGGFGLRSVRTVAVRYGGDLFTEWNNNTFTAYVTLLL